MVASIFYVLLLSFFRSNNSAKIVTYFGTHKINSPIFRTIIHVIKHILCKVLINILL